jgi:hypothetical protein
VAHFNAYKQNASRRGRGAEKELMKGALAAHARLVLRYARELGDDSFADNLRLDFVDTADILLKDEIEADISKLCDAEAHDSERIYGPVGKLFYQKWDTDNPMRCRLKPGERFFKRAGDSVYVTDLASVVRVGADLLDILNASEAEELGIIDMSINRLDYFFGVLSDGSVADEFLPYIRSNFEDTWGFRQWIREQQVLRKIL